MATLKSIKVKKDRLTDQLAKLDTTTADKVTAMNVAFETAQAEAKVKHEEKTAKVEAGIVDKRIKLEASIADVNAELQAEVATLELQKTELQKEIDDIVGANRDESEDNVETTTEEGLI